MSASTGAEPTASVLSAVEHEPDKQIVIRGARVHNLKGIDLTLPREEFIVICGPSGSGKSSLAFDTIYAEGQRRYVESLSSYARQFLERMDKPDVDSMSGLSPAMAVEQKKAASNPRSTVATSTEIYDHLRLLFARVGTTISPLSGEPVTRDTPHSVARDVIENQEEDVRFYVCFPVPHHEGRTLEDELNVLRQRGFFRLLHLAEHEAKSEASEIDLHETDLESLAGEREDYLVVVDRLAVRSPEHTRSRLAESVETAFREGGGRCVIRLREGPSYRYSAHFERDGQTFQRPTPQLFSFNNPLGACPECKGAGSVKTLDEDLIVPNPRATIREGCVAPFQTDKWSKHQRALMELAEEEGIPVDVPYVELSEEHREIIWEGKDDYIGVRGFFRFLDDKSYKMHYRIYRARFQSYRTCSACEGYRLRPEALYVRVGDRHIGEICSMTVAEAAGFFRQLTLGQAEKDVASRVLEEIRSRLEYLEEVGLHYLTLDRLAKTLSGGETQRINLATSLGSPLVGSLYVLDEPTIGLHPRDTARLVQVLQDLQELGNTVIVVEHDAAMISEADHVVELGPGAGALGGEVVYSGKYAGLLDDPDSLTGAYLSGRKTIPVPEKRRSPDFDQAITIHNASQHNLKNIDVTIPLGVLVGVTGVSGSGKTTLIHKTLYGALERVKGGKFEERVGAHDQLTGHESVESVELVDQKAIGRSTRSNSATYINVFGYIRDLLADTYLANVRGYKPGTFSFNVSGGRCENCEGEGAVTVEMQFLADLRLECEACNGKRFKKEVLDVRYRNKNIHEILELTVDQAVEFFEDHGPIVDRLSVLQDVGLGYVTLGQPTTTLSGGEAQRLKLASYLAEPATDHTLYIFDEPTTGLHFDDIQKLMTAFNGLIDAGHSVLVIEHDLDVIKGVDWVIDLGPEGGPAGGDVVVEGSPEVVADEPDSYTGSFLGPLLEER